MNTVINDFIGSSFNKMFSDDEVRNGFEFDRMDSGTVDDNDPDSDDDLLSSDLDDEVEFLINDRTFPREGGESDQTRYSDETEDNPTDDTGTII